MDMGVPSLFDDLLTRVIDAAATDPTGPADPLARLDAAVTVAAQAAGAGELPDSEARNDVPPMSAEATCAVDAAAHHAATASPDSPCPQVRTEHLLFVLALDPGGRARRVLGDLGTDIAAIKRELECYVTG